MCRKFISTVDIDLEELNDLELEILKHRLMYICSSKNVTCSIFETSRGLHIYVSIDGICYDFWKSYVIRSFLFDDHQRMEFDIRRYERGLYRWLETLFTKKVLYKKVGRKKIKVKESVEKEVKLLL